MILAGIGARKSPQSILNEMKKLGQWACQNGHTIRSGHAPGADWWFEQGAQKFCTAYLPWSSFEEGNKSDAEYVIPDFTKTLEDIARRFHPKYDKLSQGTKKLIARNGCQILGLVPGYSTPSSAVICWTEKGEGGGGTGQAIRIARAYRIPVIDMYNFPTMDEVLNELFKYVRKA